MKLCETKPLTAQALTNAVIRAYAYGVDRGLAAAMDAFTVAASGEIH